jgi:hypothetical protein
VDRPNSQATETLTQSDVAEPGNCFEDNGNALAISAGGSCIFGVAFAPEESGTRQATLTIQASHGSSATIAMTGEGTGGYYLVGSTSETAGFGDADPNLTDDRAKVSNASTVGIASSSTATVFGRWAPGWGVQQRGRDLRGIGRGHPSRGAHRRYR